MEKLRLSIPNLSCAACVAEIEKLLRAQEGVIWAEISFAAKEVALVYDPIAFSLAGLVRSLDTIGLSVSALARSISEEKSEADRPAGQRGARRRDRSAYDAARAAIAHYRR